MPDFSERGCAVAVDACLPTGATRVVTFVAPHQVRATLTIIVVECRRLDAGKFRLHCRFLGDDRSIADRAKLLLDAVRRQRPSLVAARSAGSGAA